MANEDERRRAERIPINTEFAAMPSATYISDLSEYGVFVHTSEPAPLGTKLRLRFTVLLGDPFVISAEGRVVRHASEPTPGMGIEFTELDPETIQRIGEVLTRQQPRDSGPPLSASGEAAQAETAPSHPSEDADMDGPLGDLPEGGGGWSFKVPPLPGSGREDIDESQKTGLFRKVETEPVDDDSE